jgi:hypothetical protein
MVDLHHLAEARLPEVFEKWGFGMAPPKPETQISRKLWARTVIKAIVDPAAPPWPQRRPRSHQRRERHVHADISHGPM